MTFPSGEHIVRCQAPPGRTSALQAMIAKPCGPHHRERCSGSVHASKTNRRGASKMRRMTSSAVAVAVSAAAILRVLGLQLAQIFVEPSKAFFPEAAVVLKPIGSVLERCRIELARPPLRPAATCNQAGSLQHLQVLGDGGEADVKGLGEFVNRGFPRGETSKDRTPGRVRQGSVGGAEAIGRHLTDNHKVKRGGLQRGSGQPTKN